MKLKTTTAFLVFALLATSGCVDRIHTTPDASATNEAGAIDHSGQPSVDAGGDTTAPAVDAVAIPDTASVPDAFVMADVVFGQDSTTAVVADVGGGADIQPADLRVAPDAAADVAVAVSDGPADVAVAVSDGRADVAVDVPADSPALTPDASAGACQSNSDCPGTCQMCNASHTCVTAVSQDDPNARCAGTCDATGACKSKKGQNCQTVASGCASGTTCSPDGYCCDQACAGSCQACDIPGFLGTCTPVAAGNPHGNRAPCGTDATCGGTCAGKLDGACSYPTKSCGAGPSCSGTGASIAQSTCASGACQTPPAVSCQGGFACSGTACNTTCQTSADCQADYFCYNQTCHSDVVSVGLGGAGTCAVLKDGRVMCWGKGYLGDGVNHASPVSAPVQVSGLTNAQAVRASSNSACAVTSLNTILCWGGVYGQLGSGTDTTSNTPVPVVTSIGSPLAGVASLYAGANSFCATSSTNTYCWGRNSGGGSLGFATPANPTSILSATPIQGAPALSLLAMGGLFQVGIQNARDVYPWGHSVGGLIVSGTGTGDFPAWDAQTFMVDVNVAQVVAGTSHVCLLYVTGEVQCWGTNTSGQLGNGTNGADAIPGHKIAGFTASHLSAGSDFNCAQTSDLSNIVCWGSNASGIINPDAAANPQYSVPTTVLLNLAAGLTVKEVVASESFMHVCTILSDGSLMCWGDNNFLETGTGQTSSFVTVPSLVQANW